VMALQVDAQTLVTRVQDPAAGGAALFGAKAVGDSRVHDALDPASAGEVRPVGSLLNTPHAADQPPPQRSLTHVSLPSPGPASSGRRNDSTRQGRGRRCPNASTRGAS